MGGGVEGTRWHDRASGQRLMRRLLLMDRVLLLLLLLMIVGLSQGLGLLIRRIVRVEGLLGGDEGVEHVQNHLRGGGSVLRRLRMIVVGRRLSVVQRRQAVVAVRDSTDRHPLSRRRRGYRRVLVARIRRRR